MSYESAVCERVGCPGRGTTHAPLRVVNSDWPSGDGPYIELRDEDGADCVGPEVDHGGD